MIYAALSSYAMIFAQVGIGTTTVTNSAILDMDVSGFAPKKGFLTPRVHLANNTDVATIPNPALNLMVYNLAANGTGTSAVKANSFYVWDGAIWQKTSNLAEIRALKVPIEFVLSSLNQQNLSATDLVTINSNTNPSSVVTVVWQPSDVSIPNPSDVQPISGGNALKILTTSYYQLSGMMNFRANIDNVTYGAGATSHVVISLQSAATETGPWTDVIASTLPYEQYAANQVQTIVFPTVVKYFSANTVLRLVVSKPAGANPYQTGGILVANPGVDITKSFRIIRLQQ